MIYPRNLPTTDYGSAKYREGYRPSAPPDVFPHDGLNRDLERKVKLEPILEPLVDKLNLTLLKLNDQGEKPVGTAIIIIIAVVYRHRFILGRAHCYLVVCRYVQ